MNLKRVLLLISLLFVLSFVIPVTFLIIDGLMDELNQADVAVVLGNTVNPDGNPSPRLQARLDKTVELYQKGLFKNIIVSGGFGNEGFDEALVMKNYLVKQGIPTDNIIQDGKGNTTILTAKNASEIMKQNNWKSVLIISQYFHISRCKLAFSKYDISPIFSAHTEYFELRDFYSIIREVIGYYSYFLNGRTDKI